MVGRARAGQPSFFQTHHAAGIGDGCVVAHYENNSALRRFYEGDLPLLLKNSLKNSQRRATPLIRCVMGLKKQFFSSSRAASQARHATKHRSSTNHAQHTKKKKDWLFRARYAAGERVERNAKRILERKNQTG
jgi:hypothetical protein